MTDSTRHSAGHLCVQHMDSSSAEAPCAADSVLRSATCILGQSVNIPRLRSVDPDLANTRAAACRCGICCIQRARGRRLRAGGANRPPDPHIMVRSWRVWPKLRRRPPPPASRRRQSQLALLSIDLLSAPRWTRPRASSVWRRLAALHRHWRKSELRCEKLFLRR